MEVSVLVAVVAVVVAILGWRVLNWLWLRPMKLEKQLRRQGLNGNSYKLLYGDMKEFSKMAAEASSKPIGLSDDHASRVLPFINKATTIYGKIFFSWVGPKPMVHMMDTELIREILTKYNQFQKNIGSSPLIKFLPRGLFQQEGKTWVKRRKIINPAFHKDKLKNMVSAFYLSFIEMIEKWEELIIDNKEEDGSCELDVWPYLQTSTADVISRSAFGSSYEQGRRIFELQIEQGRLLAEAQRSFYIPGTSFLSSKRNRRMKEIVKEVNSLVKDIINQRLNKAGGDVADDDLLGILLESNSNEIKQQGNKYSGLSIDEIIEECKVFYFGGQETTSILLAWTMVLLSQHQNWQKQAREEVVQVFGNKKPDHDGLNRLKIVSMILDEVLRLYPPIVELSRMIQEEMKIGKYTLPAGVFIQIPILLLHHDRELWGDDADEFKPERFSQGVSQATNGKISYLPFGYGPRICIGLNFSMLEAKMALAMILQRFSFALSPSYSHAPVKAITLQPQYGVHLILQKL